MCDISRGLDVSLLVYTPKEVESSAWDVNLRFALRDSIYNSTLHWSLPLRYCKRRWCIMVIIGDPQICDISRGLDVSLLVYTPKDVAGTLKRKY